MADAPPPQPSADAPQNPQELNQFVENLLVKMQDRFEDMSKQILGKIDTMSQRIEELEKSIGTLMEQAGLEEQADEKAEGK